MNFMENEKQIGLVKWFHDKSKDLNHGFIQHIKLGDLYFNENSIENGQDIQSFRENAIVIFKAIIQESLVVYSCCQIWCMLIYRNWCSCNYRLQMFVIL
jgi:hypothetical protein